MQHAHRDVCVHHNWSIMVLTASNHQSVFAGMERYRLFYMISLVITCNRVVNFRLNTKQIIINTKYINKLIKQLILLRSVHSYTITFLEKTVHQRLLQLGLGNVRLQICVATSFIPHNNLRIPIIINILQSGWINEISKMVQLELEKISNLFLHTLLSISVVNIGNIYILEIFIFLSLSTGPFRNALISSQGKKIGKMLALF